MTSLPTRAFAPQASSPGSDNHLDAAGRASGVEQRTRRHVSELVKRGIITLAGVLGVLAVLVAVSPFFGWAVVRLATGSMAPTFPTNSLLLAHSVPASRVGVGDVVMVARPGELPVTHRVVSATVVSAGEVALTLKGDANRTADPRPYLVRSVDVVVGGIPWGGSVFAALRSTVGLASLTVLATLIVLWGWWPKRATKGAEK
jgi:signal peptidase